MEQGKKLMDEAVAVEAETELDAAKDNNGGVATGGNKGEDMEQGKKLVDEAVAAKGKAEWKVVDMEGMCSEGFLVLGVLRKVLLKAKLSARVLLWRGCVLRVLSARVLLLRKLLKWMRRPVQHQHL